MIILFNNFTLIPYIALFPKVTSESSLRFSLVNSCPLGPSSSLLHLFSTQFILSKIHFPFSCAYFMSSFSWQMDPL